MDSSIFSFLLETWFCNHTPPGKVPCPTPPVSVKNDILYMRYRVMPPGTIILIPDTKVPFTYGPDKTVLKAVGGLPSESTVGNLNSSHWKLHKFYETTRGPYHEQCEECHTRSAEDLMEVILTIGGLAILPKVLLLRLPLMGARSIARKTTNIDKLWLLCHTNSGLSGITSLGPTLLSILCFGLR